MNIAVCIKQVPDTEARIKIKEGALDFTDVKMVVSPFDEFAVEEAIRIKEKVKGEVTIISMGTDKAKEAIKWAFSIGADKGILLKDAAFEKCDSLGTAKVLAAAIKKGEYDLILCGKTAVDEDQSQVPQAMAAILDVPHVSVVTKLELAEDGASAVCHREVEGGTELIQTSFPAVISAEKGLNEVRYASLKGIMAAKRKKLDEMDAAALGIDVADAKIKVVALNPPPVRAAGKIVEGDSAEAKAKALVQLLKDEAKVI